MILYLLALLTIPDLCKKILLGRVSLTQSKLFNSFGQFSMGSTKKGSILFAFTGDLMIGRGIDAILPDHADGRLYEGYVRHANQYVELAERVNGPIERSKVSILGSSYIWGDILEDIKKYSPDCFIVNLETALTSSKEPYPKGINYKTHPKNVACLQVAGVDVATLANNHILDWKENGLIETIQTLESANISHSGAGRNSMEAKRPAIKSINVDGMDSGVDLRIIAIGLPSAGVPIEWSSDLNRGGGVHFIDRLDFGTAHQVMDRFILPDDVLRSKNQIKVVSIHWGPNWQWGIPSDHRSFAHSLIDLGADVVIGHSSHHIKGMEIYKGKFISYGLGDFLNDYEGIVGQGYETFRDDLSCLYLPRLNAITGDVIEVSSKARNTSIFSHFLRDNMVMEVIIFSLTSSSSQVTIIPCKIKNFKVQRTYDLHDIEWLRSTFSKEGSLIGTRCETKRSGKKVNLRLVWEDNSKISFV